MNTLIKSFFVGSILIASTSVSAQKVELFNGKNLNNWNFFLDTKSTAKPAEIFSVEDAVITIKGTPFGYMYTKEMYDNFHLHLQWRWEKTASNSGIFLFVQPGEKLWPNAIEAQLCAGQAGDFVLLGGSDVSEFKTKPGEKRPDFPVVEKLNPSNEKPAGEWNTADIYCRNGSIVVVINGEVQNMGTQSMHKKGYIGLQSEGEPIQFRDIWLKKL